MQGLLNKYNNDYYNQQLEFTYRWINFDTFFVFLIKSVLKH